MQRFAGDRYDDAAELFREVALDDAYPTFLTVPAYTRFLVHARPATSAGTTSPGTATAT
ncbi:MAG: malate synthase [Cellulomonas sp.]|nr:malate synthase [Cellulomonas sp.]